MTDCAQDSEAKFVRQGELMIKMVGSFFRSQYNERSDNALGNSYLFHDFWTLFYMFLGLKFIARMMRNVHSWQSLSEDDYPRFGVAVVA